MDNGRSFGVPLEEVREETPLAPMLLQTEGLITDLLGERLHRTVTSTTVEKRMDRIGFVRRSLVSANGTPLYLAVTVVTRGPWTQPLARELRKEHPPLFGNLLKQRHLFHHKTTPMVQRVQLTPDVRAVLQLGDDVERVWERTYAILTPKNKKVAGVTEIFSPKLEALLRASPAPADTGASLPAPTL